MKIQKILEQLDPNSRAYLIRQLIISRLDDVKDIKEKITANEKELFEEVKSILQKDTSLNEYLPFFNLMVSTHEEGAKYRDTLLNVICLQVAQSVSKLYNQPQEKGNAFVGFGGRQLTISESAFFDQFIIEGIENEESKNLYRFFEKFNEVMKPYDIWIKQIDDTVSKHSPLSIHLRILK